MAFEAIELVCGCCELCLSVAELGSSKKEARNEKTAQTARVVRMAREEKRGVRLAFAKRRIVEIEFLSGPAAGKRASTMPDMELKRLALAMPHRTARFAIRRFLIHRKAGRIAAPEDAVIRR